MDKHYIMDKKGNISTTKSIKKWAEFYKLNKIIKQTTIIDKNQNNILVSTVFLGSDYRFFGEGEPILFETMIFGTHEREQQRYCTKKQAIKGHNEWIKKIIRDDEKIVIQLWTCGVCGQQFPNTIKQPRCPKCLTLVD